MHWEQFHFCPSDLELWPCNLISYLTVTDSQHYQNIIVESMIKNLAISQDPLWKIWGPKFNRLI